MSPERDKPKLKRETAGRYRSEDGRYVVQQQSGPWWLMDTEQTDELGQPPCTVRTPPCRRRPMPSPPAGAARGRPKAASKKR